MHTAARPKSSKNDPKKKFPGANLETGLTSIAEAGNSTTGSIFEAAQPNELFHNRCFE